MMTTEQLAVFLQDEAQFCGCGSPEAAANALLDLLDMHPLYERHHQERLASHVPGEGFQYLLLYWLDSLDLTEHGGSVGGAWLTKKGEQLRDSLRREAETDNFESLFDNRCAHGYLVDDVSHDCMAADA